MNQKETFFLSPKGKTNQSYDSDFTSFPVFPHANKKKTFSGGQNEAFSIPPGKNRTSLSIRGQKRCPILFVIPHMM